MFDDFDTSIQSDELYEALIYEWQKEYEATWKKEMAEDLFDD